MNRRTFIDQTARSIAGAALVAAPGIASAQAVFNTSATYTVQEIIDLIIKDIPGAPFNKTVDTIKFGSAGSRVSGIVTTMFPTVEVIEKAIGLKANFIIAHEPTYYNGQDNTEWIPHNSIVLEKQQLLEKNGITIWRFHDYCHSMKPDMVAYGVLKKMGWLEYYTQGERTLTIPATTLKQLAEEFKSKLGITHLRIMGDPMQSVSRIGMIPGAGGGQMQMRLIEEKNPDVLVVGEQVEWETTEYIRDRLKLGHATSMIVLGHAVSEEPGMEAFAEWLTPKVPGIKVTHIATGDPYTWM